MAPLTVQFLDLLLQIQDQVPGSHRRHLELLSRKCSYENWKAANEGALKINDLAREVALVSTNKIKRDLVLQSKQ